jgi:hypothetical protein
MILDSLSLKREYIQASLPQFGLLEDFSMAEKMAPISPPSAHSTLHVKMWCLFSFSLNLNSSSKNSLFSTVVIVVDFVLNGRPLVLHIFVIYFHYSAFSWVLLPFFLPIPIF